MSIVNGLKFTENVARALVLDVPYHYNKATIYNKDWSWWAHEAPLNQDFAFGGGTVAVVQRRFPGEWETADVSDDTELIFSFLLDTEDAPIYYKINGEFTSYGNESWREHSFKQVKPTERTYRVFETVK